MRRTRFCEKGQSKKTEKPMNVLGAKKKGPKSLNRIAKIGYGYICLRGAEATVCCSISFGKISLCTKYNKLVPF